MSFLILYKKIIYFIEVIEHCSTTYAIISVSYVKRYTIVKCSHKNEAIAETEILKKYWLTYFSRRIFHDVLIWYEKLWLHVHADIIYNIW